MKFQKRILPSLTALALSATMLPVNLSIYADTAETTPTSAVSEASADDIFAKTGSDYARQDMLLRSNAQKRVELYDYFMEVSKAFWNSSSDIEKSDNGYSICTFDSESYGLTANEILEVYYMFKADNPLFYFASNTITITGTTVYYLTDEPYSSAASRAEYQKQITDYAESFAQYVQGTSAYEDARAIHDIICGSMEYAYQSDGVTPCEKPSSHSIIGAIEGKGVCEAYTRAYQLILNYYGIENVFVGGKSNGEQHSWNIVKLDDNNYYYVDCTLDDAESSYSYFAVGSTKLNEKHTANTSSNSGVSFLYDLPTVGSNNYITVEEHTFTQDGFTYTIHSDNTATLTEYTGNESEVVIPATADGAVVVSIGESAFFENKTIKKVTLPAYIRTLEMSCFQQCTSLSELNLPEGLKTIEQNALSDTAIKTLYFPASATEIHTFFGSNMTNLEYCEVAEGNSTYKSDNGVLYYYGPWHSFDIELDGSLTETDGGIGWCLMKYPVQKKDRSYKVLDETVCILSAEIELNEYLETINIGNAQFSAGDISCEIELGENNEYYTKNNGLILSKDGTTLIYAVNKTGDVTVPDGIVTIGTDAFRFGKASNVILPDGLKTIGNGAFSYSEVQSVYIPDTVSKIGNSAFQECPNLKQVNIPTSVKELEWNTFLSCTSLEEITIPANVEVIPLQLFADCRSLKSVTVLNPDCEIYDYENTFYEGTVLIGLENSTLQKYAEKYNRLFTVYNENTDAISVTGKCGDDLNWALSSTGILTISGTGEMYDYSPEAPAPWNSYSYLNIWFREINSVIIEDGVTYIGSHAFAPCWPLNSIIIESDECMISDSEYTIPGNTVIYGNTNSGADAYAEKYARSFVTLDKSSDALQGDINSDGEIDIADIVTIQSCLNKTKIATPALDINSDGEFNVFDLIFAKRIVLKG